MRRTPLAAVFLLSIIADVLHGQTRTGGPAVAAQARSEPVRVDGRLSEPDWALAVPAGAFVQAEPREGGEVEQPTEVRVLYDDEALYIGARMHDAAPGSIARQLVRRDEEGQYDYFEVSLDPDRDRRTGYRFRISAAGVQADSYLFDDVQQDDSWDAVWESAVAHDSLGWTAELRIPLSQLRFASSDQVQAWGVNFGRRRVVSNELSFLSLESRQTHGRVSVFGPLTGLSLPGGLRRLELRPYLLARSRTGPAVVGDPFFSGREAGGSAGLDLRYGLGSTFTLDATVNPDFGQVEVDPAVINLSAFETFFPELRPFFVEDARIFDFNLSGGDNSLFYSRRIGREPHRLGVDDADFVNAPDQTSILGAAKVTGRTRRGLSVGALAAVTGREDAEAFFASGDSTIVFLAEPRTEYGVVRLQQDLRGGRTVVGGIATAMRRELPGDGSFDFLPSHAVNGGIDFEHTWLERSWAFWGFFAGSSVMGEEEALVRLQRSSNHYFQRPDAYQLEVDSSATRMNGAEWRLQLERRGGRHWTGAVWAAQRTPGFDVNDAGYFRGSERLDGGARATYREIEPGRILRDYEVSASTFHNWRHEALQEAVSWDSWDHAHKNGSFSLSSDVTFLNYWSLDVNAGYHPEVLDDAATRGGPLMVRPAARSVRFRLNTDPRERLALEPSMDLRRSDADELDLEASFEFSYRPSSRVQLETEPRFQVERVAAQYVGAMDAPDFLPTFGRRYLFADLKRETFSLDTRLNLTFSPRLTLQLFLQPLLSVGDFTTYKQLARAESFEFERFAEGAAVTDGGVVRCEAGRTCATRGTRYVDLDGDDAVDYSFDERDFRVRSMRGNAVMRWEYRPGSTLFLVWQQRRAYEDLDASAFDLYGEVGDLLSDPMENVFIIKANYWLSL